MYVIAWLWDTMASAIAPTLLYGFKHSLGHWLNLQKEGHIFEWKGKKKSLKIFRLTLDLTLNKPTWGQVAVVPPVVKCQIHLFRSSTSWWCWSTRIRALARSCCCIWCPRSAPGAILLLPGRRLLRPRSDPKVMRPKVRPSPGSEEAK